MTLFVLEASSVCILNLSSLGDSIHAICLTNRSHKTLRQANSSSGIRRVSISTDPVGKFLSDRRAAHHDFELLP